MIFRDIGPSLNTLQTDLLTPTSFEISDSDYQKTNAFPWTILMSIIGILFIVVLLSMLVFVCVKWRMDTLSEREHGRQSGLTTGFLNYYLFLITLNSILLNHNQSNRSIFIYNYCKL